MNSTRRPNLQLSLGHLRRCTRSTQLRDSYVRLLPPILLIICVTPILVAGEEPVFLISRPTVIAFFPPVTEKELAKDPDTNEALADFQFYLVKAREPLKRAGIDLFAAYAHSFRIRRGKKVSTFRPKGVDVGYYFVAPGKKPNVTYGVETDSGIFESIQKYFGIVIR
jgi:hypothetical protein